MFSFIIRYRPVLTFLFVIGSCPLTIESGGTVKCTRLNQYFNSFVSGAFLIIISALTTNRTMTIFSLKNGPSIQMLGTVAQMISVTIVYGTIVFHSIRTGPAHAALLNDIVSLDNRIVRKLSVVEARELLGKDGFYYWHFLEIVLLIGTFTITIMSANLNMPEQNFQDYFLVTAIVFDILIVIILGLMLHVRFCAKLLSVRHRLINVHLAAITSSSSSLTDQDYWNALELFDTFFRVREQFKQIFQFELLMNAMFNFIAILMTTFFVGSTLLEWLLHAMIVTIGITGALIVVPLCQCVLLVSAASEFGHQVHYLTNIYYNLQSK